MNLTAAIANSLWAASSIPALTRFRRALDRPAETQRQLLLGYLALNADSAYGRAHEFARIRTYEEYTRRVPLIGYDELEPWIARIRRGDRRVLTREPVSHLIPTSGSSGPIKLIPFTAGLQREFNRAIGPWIADLFRCHPSLVFGRSYWSITPAAARLDAGVSAVPIGFEDDSAYLGGWRRQWVNAVMVRPVELGNVSDMEIFRYLTLLCLLRESDLSLISVWHPSFLALLLDALPVLWDNLLSDIGAGRCRYSDALPAAVHDALDMCPARSRARQLERVDPARPETLWPRLRVISCWGDGNAEPARADLQSRFPATVIQPKGLLATEAFVTIPYRGLRPLAIGSHFFEFMDAQGRIHLAHDLRENETYEVIVTNAGGLWRYRLGDEVRVTGFAGGTPALQFLGRKGNVSDRFGEKLSEAFVSQALEKAMAGLSPAPTFALLAPDENGSVCWYTLYVEGFVPPSIVLRLDAILRANPHYSWSRDLGQLKPLHLFRIRAGGYEAFAAREAARGRRLGDIKPCPLSCETGWSDSFDGAYVDTGGESRPEQGASRWMENARS